MVEINFMIFMNAQHSHTWNIKTEIIVGIHTIVTPGGYRPNQFIRVVQQLIQAKVFCIFFTELHAPFGPLPKLIVRFFNQCKCRVSYLWTRLEEVGDHGIAHNLQVRVYTFLSSVIFVDQAGRGWIGEGPCIAHKIQVRVFYIFLSSIIFVSQAGRG